MSVNSMEQLGLFPEPESLPCGHGHTVLTNGILTCWLCGDRRPPCEHTDTVPVDNERVCWRCGEILGAVE